MQYQHFCLVILSSIGLFCVQNLVHTATIDNLDNSQFIEFDQIYENDDTNTSAFFIPYYWTPYSLNKRLLTDAIDFIDDDSQTTEKCEENNQTVPEENSDDSINTIFETNLHDGTWNDSKLKKVLEIHIETAIKYVFYAYVDTLLAAKQTLIKNADCIKHIRNNIPIEKRKEFYTCVDDRSNQLFDATNHTIQTLYKAKQLITAALDKLRECRRKKREFVRMKQQKEQIKMNKNLSIEKCDKILTFFQLFRNVINFFRANGCYILASGKIAMNTTVLCMDIVTTYTDVKDIFTETVAYVKDCVTTLWNKWIVSFKCTGFGKS